MTLGERIKELRENKKMTQNSLAEILFVSDKTVSKWEIGKSEPEINILIKMCEIFNVSLEFLTTGTTKDNKIGAISKIELACREDNIALLKDVDLDSFDSYGKDIHYYVDKYNAKNVKRYLNDIAFNTWVDKKDYEKNKKRYLICAIPKDKKSENSLVLLIAVNDKNLILEKCVELENKGYHGFRIFREKEIHEKCPLNYQELSFDVINFEGDVKMNIIFRLLDDDKSGYFEVVYEDKGGKFDGVKTRTYVRPDIVLNFVNELDAIDFNSWDSKYWGYPVCSFLYTLKKDEDDMTFSMYNKFYVSPEEEKYVRFVKAIQNVALQTMSNINYERFVYVFNADLNPRYRKNMHIKLSSEVFRRMEAEIKFNNGDF